MPEVLPDFVFADRGIWAQRADLGFHTAFTCGGENFNRNEIGAGRPEAGPGAWALGWSQFVLEIGREYTSGE